MSLSYLRYNSIKSKIKGMSMKLQGKNNLSLATPLYAKDLEGYKNLMYLSSQACLYGFHMKPRISKKMLREYSKGLICSSA